MSHDAEFDAFVSDYEDQHRASILLSGEEPQYFADYKIQVLKDLTMDWAMKAPNILDFGSGLGGSLPAFRTYFPQCQVTCCDVSQESLKASRRKYGGDEQYILIENGIIPVIDKSFDIVFSACVFHHIPHDEHLAWINELRRIVKPGGALVIFEHNPWNPLTRYAVRKCPFDVNAHLINSRQLRRVISISGWDEVQIDYHVFFPSVLAPLRRLDSRLRWLAIGAQYCCHARRKE